MRMAGYRPDIDGLRAVAVLAVVGYHFFPGPIPSGFVGVDIFFVISGFLISGLILDDLAENRFSLSSFYARRIRRLFPALILVLAFTLAVGWLVLFPGEYAALGKHAAGGAGFIANILYWLESGYFEAEAAAKPLLHLWSLGIEEQFYIAFPCLLVLAWKKGLRGGLFIAPLLLASLGCNLYLEYRDQAADFYLPPARFWELLLGAVLACLHRSGPACWPRRALCALNALLLRLIYKNPDQGGHPLNTLLSALGVSLIAYSLAFIRNPPAWPGRWAIVPALGAALILAAGPGSFFNRHILSRRLAVGLGLISYPLYLWHWPVISYLRIVNGGLPDRHTRVIGVLAALVLAGLTYRLVEYPLRFGPRFRARKTVILGLLMIAAAGAGLFIHSRDGLPGRPIKSPDYTTEAPYDDACPAYTGVPADVVANQGDFNFFCRFSGEPGQATVALIGDSHALSAYFGMAKFNASIGLNTLLMARGGRVGALLAGLKAGTGEDLIARNQELERQVFEVLRRPEIKAVFIFLWQQHALHNPDQLQDTINILAEAGKEVFLCVDWPRLPRNGLDYVERPYAEFFRPKVADLYRGLERRGLANAAREYFERMRSMKNATIIDGTWEAFCPDTECLVFSARGQLLYWDITHLTNAGSEFLAETVLAPYLRELARHIQYGYFRPDGV